MTRIAGRRSKTGGRGRWMSVGVLALGTLIACAPARSLGQAAAEPPERVPAMAVDADPSFEVATVRPSDPAHPLETEGSPIAHRSVFADTNLRFLLAFVYDVHDKQIVDAPAWLGKEAFDIVGVANVPGTPSLEQLKTMERKLLIDRFQLKFHWEKREMSAYVLTSGKGDAKLQKSEDLGGPPSFIGRPDRGMKGQNLTMANFAQLLQSGIMDRPVVDHTGLAGKFDFTLRWLPDQSQMGGRFPATDSPDTPPGIFTALQEQLGLRLTAEETPVEVMVIDRVEQPSPN